MSRKESPDKKEKTMKEEETKDGAVEEGNEKNTDKEIVALQSPSN